jgi:hypothetical protein
MVHPDKCIQHEIFILHNLSIFSPKHVISSHVFSLVNIKANYQHCFPEEQSTKTCLYFASIFEVSTCQFGSVPLDPTGTGPPPTPPAAQCPSDWFSLMLHEKRMTTHPLSQSTEYSGNLNGDERFWCLGLWFLPPPDKPIAKILSRVAVRDY